MSHYDNCRPGYCPKCGAAPGNIKKGVCEICHPSKTKHLDNALAILKGTAAAKRAKTTTFTLTRTGYTVNAIRHKARSTAVLQGPRGKTVRTWADMPWDDIKAEAIEHTANIPGATLTIYD